LRVKITLARASSEQEIKMPLDFRRHFISFIKTMIKGSQAFTRFEEERPGYSPYVFSINFKQIIDINRTLQEMTVKPPITMTVSSGLFDPITAICNGAIVSKGEKTVLGLTVQDVQLLPLKQIRSNMVEFKIAGHAVLRSAEDYVDGSNIGELEEAINTHLVTKAGFLRNGDNSELPENKITAVRVLPPAEYRKGVCYHYGGQLTTLQGKIRLAGSPEALQFLYDFGLGVRTGQGFGLLEVVNEL